MLKLKGSNNRQIIDHKSVDKISINIIMYSLRYNGSAQLTGEAPGLQIRCGALKPSRVGSIPMHFRHILFITFYIYILTQNPHFEFLKLHQIYELYNLNGN